MMPEDILPPLFAETATSLEMIDEAGWIRDSNGYNWWWCKKDNRHDLQSAPYWVRQLTEQAEKRGVEMALREMRIALGIEDGKKKPKASK